MSQTGYDRGSPVSFASRSPLESLDAERLGDLGMEDLEGDGAVVLEVGGEEDRCHAHLISRCRWLISHPCLA
jgi:hypothetical protein